MKQGVFVAAAKKAEQFRPYWAGTSSGCQVMGM
jgi:hypothetical protein